MRAIILLFAMLAAGQVGPSDKSTITVKQTSVSGDVVVITIQEAGKPFELQCTKNAPYCVVPQAGDYVMVRLPKNHGYYDCANVELYQKSAAEGNSDSLGQYCINEK